MCQQIVAVWVNSFQVAICKLSVRNCTSSGKRQQYATTNQIQVNEIDCKYTLVTLHLTTVLQGSHTPHTCIAACAAARQGIFSKPKGAANE